MLLDNLACLTLATRIFFQATTFCDLPLWSTVCLWNSPIVTADCIGSLSTATADFGTCSTAAVSGPALGLRLGLLSLETKFECSLAKSQPLQPAEPLSSRRLAPGDCCNHWL